MYELSQHCEAVCMRWVASGKQACMKWVTFVSHLCNTVCMGWIISVRHCAWDESPPGDSTVRMWWVTSVRWYVWGRITSVKLYIRGDSCLWGCTSDISHLCEVYFWNESPLWGSVNKVRHVCEAVNMSWVTSVRRCVLWLCSPSCTSSGSAGSHHSCSQSAQTGPCIRLSYSSTLTYVQP
jgi:hypothetical protein